MRTLVRKDVIKRKPSLPLRLLRLLLFLIVISYLTLSVAGAEIYTRNFNRTSGPITPATYDLAYSEVSFPAIEDQLTLRAWFIPAASDQVIIAVHGKGSSRATWLPKIVPFAKKDYNLLLFDLRGHGTSDGDHLSYGLYEQRDVLGAIEYLKKRGFQARNMAIFGESMGAATGLLVMGRNHEIRAMVSDSAYANLNDELQAGYDQLVGRNLPLSGLLYPGMLVAARLLQGIDTNQVQPETAIRTLQNQHVLLIQGQADTLVAPQNGQRLKLAAGEAADLWLVPNAQHVGAYSREPQEYTQRIMNFLHTYFDDCQLLIGVCLR